MGYHVDHPYLLFLAVPALFVFAWMKHVARLRDGVPYPPLQRHNGGKKTRRLAPFVAFLETLMLLAAFLALSGPYRSFDVTAIDEEGIDVMLAVDISASMAATDFPPTRLEATKVILDEFIRKSGGNRVGIIVFAKRVFTLSPLTASHDLLRGLVKGLSLRTIDHIQSGGTAIGDAILFASDALYAARIRDRSQVIILLTDGESNDGMEVGLATRYAADLGIKIDAIGMGSPTPVTVVPDPSDPDWNFETRLVEEPLVAVAQTTGGTYHAASGGDVLAKVFDELSRLERTPLKTGHVRQKKYARRMLLFGASGLFAVTLFLRAFFLRRPLR